MKRFLLLALIISACFYCIAELDDATRSSYMNTAGKLVDRWFGSDETQHPDIPNWDTSGPLMMSEVVCDSDITVVAEDEYGATIDGDMMTIGYYGSTYDSWSAGEVAKTNQFYVRAEDAVPTASYFTVSLLCAKGNTELFDVLELYVRDNRTGMNYSLDEFRGEIRSGGNYSTSTTYEICAKMPDSVGETYQNKALVAISVRIECFIP